MADVELLATRAADGLRALLARLASLAAGLVVVTAAIGAATYATGWWVFHGGGWVVVGLVLCALPVVAAVLAWWRVRATMRLAPSALADLRSAIGDRQSRPAMGVQIDADTQQPIYATTRSLTGLRADLEARGADWPALMKTLRAVTSVPGLAALGVLGLVAVGGFGTIVLLVGLAR